MSLVEGSLDLGFGVVFEELYGRDGLGKLDGRFTQYLRSGDSELCTRFEAARANPSSLTPKEQSALILAIAPHLEDFLGELFGITPELHALQQRHHRLAPMLALKRQFVVKKAISGVSAEQAEALDGPALAVELEALFGEPLTDDSFTSHVSGWLTAEEQHVPELALAARYAAWAALSTEGRKRNYKGVLLRTPHKLVMEHLVDVEIEEKDGIPRFRLPDDELRHRDGFALTDAGMDLPRAVGQAHYCIKCHNQGKDSCSTGLR